MSVPSSGICPPAALDARQRSRILILLMLWFSMALVNVGIVNVALPSIRHDLSAATSDLQWILSGYALSFGAVLIAAGRAGDLLGRGGLFLLGLIVFTVASLASSLSPTADMLNLTRFIAGLGAGAMSPQVYGMVQQYFSGAERGRAFGWLGVSASLSVAISPALGGALIDLGGPHWGWRLTFLINLPLGIAGIFLCWRWFPHPLLHWPASSAERTGARLKPLLRALDVPGSLLAAGAVLGILYPFVDFRTTGLHWLSLPVGLLLALSWVLWEARCARLGRPAMVDLKLFSITSFNNGLAIQTVYFLGMTSVWVLVALYMQEGAGKSAFATGLVGMPSAILGAFAAHWAGARVMDRGRQRVIAGQCLALFGLLLSMAVIGLHARLGISIWWLLLSLSIYGLGQGAVISPNQSLTLAEVSLADAGSAGSMVSASQRIGASIGIAMVTGIVFAILPHANWARASIAGFACIAALLSCAIAISWKDLRDSRKALLAQAKDN